MLNIMKTDAAVGEEGADRDGKQDAETSRGLLQKITSALVQTKASPQLSEENTVHRGVSVVSL